MILRARTVFDEDESNNIKTSSISIKDEKDGSYLTLVS